MMKVLSGEIHWQCRILDFDMRKRKDKLNEGTKKTVPLFHGSGAESSGSNRIRLRDNPINSVCIAPGCRITCIGIRDYRQVVASAEGVFGDFLNR